MKTLDFDTGLLPAAERLRMFRLGAVDFEVDALGDPLDFAVRWRLLKLGDLSVLHSTASPLRYRRDPARIAADGDDRIAIHCYVQGGASGMLDGKPAQVAAGGATVWDLTRPLDFSANPLEMLIVTAPRYMFDEVMTAASYSCVLPPSPELALAADQVRQTIALCENIADEAATFLGRAIRNLFAAAMLPALGQASATRRSSNAPLFRRICDHVDAQPAAEHDETSLAAALHVGGADVRDAIGHVGDLAEVVERRRLLAAYRLLCAPDGATSVAEIAWRCGFDDHARFSKRFRNAFATTPRELREFGLGRLPEWAGAYHVERNYETLLIDR